MSANNGVSLDDIPGLGPVRRQALAEAGIQDLHTLLRTKVVELAAVRGIGIWQARRIREFLRQRGLVLAEEEDGSVVLANVHTPEEVEVVSEAMNAIQETAAHEAEVEEEVEMLVHALEEARAGTAPEESAPEDAGESAPYETPADGPEAVEPEASESEADPQPDETSEEGEEPVEAAPAEPQWSDEIRSQREQLPESALALMDAIRQAAVTRQLTRQLTRFLITAGEFATDSRPLGSGKQRKASQALAQVEQALQRAAEKRTFRPSDQKELADRIRRRRKELEKLLEQAEE